MNTTIETHETDETVDNTCPCCGEVNTGEWIEVDCGHEEVCENCDGTVNLNPTGCPWDDYEVSSCTACAEDTDWSAARRRARSVATGGAWTV